MTTESGTRVLHLSTTVASLDDARRLARALVEHRLAACVQIETVESHYRWDGAACAEPEVRLVVKSAPGLVADLQAWLDREHPYEVPQVLWHLEDASAGYAAWVLQEVARR